MDNILKIIVVAIFSTVVVIMIMAGKQQREINKIVKECEDAGGVYSRSICFKKDSILRDYRNG